MRDGHQGISHDRILMRIKDYLQIATTIGAVLWGGVKLVRMFERLNIKLETMQSEIVALAEVRREVAAFPDVRKEISFLQNQMSRLEAAVLYPEMARKASRGRGRKPENG